MGQLPGLEGWYGCAACNSRKGYTFRFNMGLLLTSIWDCYRLGAVPKVTILDYIGLFLPVLLATNKLTAGNMVKVGRQLS